MRTTSERRGPSPSGLTYPTGHPLRVRRVSRVTFFAFLGLGITFTKDLANPSRQLPRTVYLALAVAALNYVAIAFGVSAPDCEEGDLLRKYRTGAGRRPNGRPGGIPAEERDRTVACHQAQFPPIHIARTRTALSGGTTTKPQPGLARS